MTQTNRSARKRLHWSADDWSIRLA